MTWDVYAVRAPVGVRRLEDLPAGFTPPPLGSVTDVVATFREAAPEVDAADPAWLRLVGPDHDVDVALGKALHVRDVTFYVNGGDGSVAVILDVSRRLGVTAFDTESGERLTPESKPPTPAPLADDELAAERKRHWWQRRR
jgi:hypothetical protein